MHRLMQCPACPTKLQPVSPSSQTAERAWLAAEREQVPLPEHGPAAAGWLGLIAHAQLCHPSLSLRLYLEAYMRS